MPCGEPAVGPYSLMTPAVDPPDHLDVVVREPDVLVRADGDAPRAAGGRAVLVDDAGGRDPPDLANAGLPSLTVSVNQRLLSGPTMMPCGEPVGPYSLMTPAVVIASILVSPASVNQRLLSGPAVM